MMKPLIGIDLKRFLRDYKRAHRPERQVAALLQSVEFPVNVGSIFRMADAAGLSELVLAGITPTPPHPTIDKVGRHKSKNVPWRYEEDAADAARRMKEEGYHIVAVELAQNAVPYHRYDYPQRTCLVVGHEDHGVTRATLRACDAVVFIPMYGKGRSMNVHVSLSIVVFHVLHCTRDAS